jgi:type IV secretory pathway component VirB8
MKWLIHLTKLFALFAGITPPRPEQEARAALFLLGLAVLLLLIAGGFIVAMLPIMKVH